MDSLANYGSDDDYDSCDDKKQEWKPKDRKEPQRRRSTSQADANYEEVQMDLSEESESSSPPPPAPSSSHSERRRSDRERSRRTPPSRETHKERSKYDEDRRRKRRRSRSSSRETRRRSRSRERRRYRSGSRERERARRSDSREKHSKRYERGSGGGKSLQSEKIEVQKCAEEQQRRNSEPNKANGGGGGGGAGGGGGDRFFMPGITGRFREQIERRKMLWQKKEPEKRVEATPTGANANDAAAAAGCSRSVKVWETTTFAQDRDGKVASKFKRLMGIRNQSDGAAVQTDVLKKQEEMFSSMEQQYEVARTATHTMRGVGLGFGSFQR